MKNLGGAIEKLVHEALAEAGIDGGDGGNLVIGNNVTVDSTGGDAKIVVKGIKIRVTDDAVYLESKPGESRRLFVDGREIT